jgi:GH25 family lysozyme M1 (1,4-beta-N-acetylmuramidase)
MSRKVLIGLLSSLLVFGSLTAIPASAYSTKDQAILAKGVDISYWQGDVKFNRLAKNVDYVILRAGYGSSNKDVMFDKYVTEAKKNNMNIGAYWFSYATTTKEAEKEAYKCLEVLGDTQFEYPIFYDIEQESILDLSADEISDIVCTFCDILEDHGYYTGVYTYQWLANNKFNDKVGAYDVWLADIIHDEVSYKYPIGMWQNSLTVKIDGIDENLDFNYAYKDYPSIMKRNKLNGFK